MFKTSLGQRCGEIVMFKRCLEKCILLLKDYYVQGMSEQNVYFYREIIMLKTFLEQKYTVVEKIVIFERCFQER